MRYALCSILALVVCSVAVSAQADLLDTPVPHDPWVFSTSIFVNYEVFDGIGTLTADGYPDTYNKSATEEGLYMASGEFHLTASLNTDGTFNSGTLSLTGSEAFGDPDPAILFNSTNLTAFGLNTGENGEFFEFHFTQEGAGIPPLNEPFVVKLFPMGVSTGAVDLGQSFTNDYLGQSDTFYLPEPTSLTVLALAGLALLKRRRQMN